MNVQNLRGKLLISLLLGLLVFAGLSIYADFRDVISSLRDFNWALLPLILALTTMNYVFRFVKWEYYLRLIGVRGLSKRDSFLVFFSGLGMVITPGKVGEWLKSYLLREVHGTAIARSAPILIAERLTDSVALLVIAAAGVFVFGDFWQAFVAVSLGAIAIVLVARHRPTAMALLRLGERMPMIQRYVPQLREFYESTYVLLSPRALLEMGALSTLSWFFEVLGFYFTLVGLGLDGNGELLLQSAFILPIATLAAALLFTPGGLGVAEAGITGLSQALLDLSKSAAAVG
ncbi:MAG: lysylphosphatidylglycerol synthase transmembrane domain-containing protein, partial [Dehalococcoidia bacterium]|nr:lysylphosphatidylglycerol synthase transmembrane domain-containing protein [Dehalococcoidia bacterium]